MQKIKFKAYLLNVHVKYGIQIPNNAYRVNWFQLSWNDNLDIY